MWLQVPQCRGGGEGAAVPCDARGQGAATDHHRERPVRQAHVSTMGSFNPSPPELFSLRFSGHRLRLDLF